MTGRRHVFGRRCRADLKGQRVVSRWRGGGLHYKDSLKIKDVHGSGCSPVADRLSKSRTWTAA